MNNPAKMPVTIFVVASLLIIGSLSVIPSYQAQASSPELVPLPDVQENHSYNQPGYDHGNQTSVTNEGWALNIQHGGTTLSGGARTALAVRNITQFIDNATWVDYSFYITYWIGGTVYVAQFMITETVFKIGNQTIQSSLSTCADFELTHSPVKYDGTIPTLDCNISFEKIRVYDHSHADSTFDMTLLHHYRGDWNQSIVKVEALLDFNNTRFYQSNGTEFSAGEPFTAELHYRMYMTEPDAAPDKRFITPTGQTNTTLEYNLTLDNGSPLTVSRLEMKDSFTVYNETGSHASIGYSSLFASPVFSPVTHGFPNLTYRDTTSMKSDPEIVVNHDRVTEITNPMNQGGPQWGLVAAVIVIACVGAVGAVVFLKKRKKNELEKGGKKQKNP